MEKQKILVVDDIKENLDVVKGILSDDYNVLLAVNGILGLKIAYAQRPDLILLDIMMPDIDGYEVCRRLKADPVTSGIPIIFLTAMDQVKDEVKGFMLGAADFIMKPISPPIVTSRVKTHLALADQRRDLQQQVEERTIDLNRALETLEKTNNALEQAITKTEETRLEIIRRLGRAAEFKDNETGLHVIRMSHYSHLLAKAIGLDDETVTLILNAAPMHDVGKIGIPDHILLKPGKLDNDEWKVMRRHPGIGAAIIGKHDHPLMQMSQTVALTHHEKWDGSGYPKGLKGEEIPLVGRIISVADVFDALTTARPYKEAWSVEKAIELMKTQRGSHFEPRLVDLFVGILPEVLKIKKRHSEK
ncbi:MAG: two-component system response regulator [Magnetococcales bacterium]|nr:two-component system response regulator [Magnetococcales bacterium]